MLDNFDSFTFNLVHYLEAEGADVHVARNNEIELQEIDLFDQIVLSPGPSLPKDAGIMPALISEYVTRKKFLGVCLGMQAIVQHFGGELFNLPTVMHGVQRTIVIDQKSSSTGLYNGFLPSIKVGLYHSWGVKKEHLPSVLVGTAFHQDVVMSIEHENLPVWGVQYHPESILTPEGKQIIRNWLKL